MDNPVAAGISRISLMNLTDEEVLETQIVLEVYDGENRIQIEFEDLNELYDVVDRSPDDMMGYFRENLFDSPEMDDPEDALLKMAETAGTDGLVTVPPEGDDEELFDVMTAIFQKTAERSGTSDNGQGSAGGDFLQSLVRDQDDPGNDK